jgi:hypothetical protein
MSANVADPARKTTRCEQKRELVPAEARGMRDRRSFASLGEDLSLAAPVGSRLFPAEEALLRRDLPFYDRSLSPETVVSLNRLART